MSVSPEQRQELLATGLAAISALTGVELTAGEPAGERPGAGSEAAFVVLGGERASSVLVLSEELARLVVESVSGSEADSAPPEVAWDALLNAATAFVAGVARATQDPEIISLTDGEVRPGTAEDLPEARSTEVNWLWAPVSGPEGPAGHISWVAPVSVDVAGDPPSPSAEQAAADGPLVTPDIDPMEVTAVTPAAFPELGEGAESQGGADLSFLSEVSLGVTVELGRTALKVRDLLDLGEGSVVELDRTAGSPVDVLVNGSLVAYGEVVVIDDELGVRILQILDAAEVRGS